MNRLFLSLFYPPLAICPLERNEKRERKRRVQIQKGAKFCVVLLKGWPDTRPSIGLQYRSIPRCLRFVRYSPTYLYLSFLLTLSLPSSLFLSASFHPPLICGPHYPLSLYNHYNNQPPTTNPTNNCPAQYLSIGDQHCQYGVRSDGTQGLAPGQTVLEAQLGPRSTHRQPRQGCQRVPQHRAFLRSGPREPPGLHACPPV